MEPDNRGDHLAVFEYAEVNCFVPCRHWNFI